MRVFGVSMCAHLYTELIIQRQANVSWEVNIPNIVVRCRMSVCL